MPILSTRGAASYRGFVTQSYGTSFSASYLVVAGGGAGGTNGVGGGGGAGGLLTGTASLSVGTTYTVTVGSGGATSSPPSKGGNGVSSSITSANFSTTATGGGGGGTNFVGIGNANNGGSGGGAGGDGTYTGGSGTSGQGYAGGNSGGSNLSGGGGGGAGAIGSNGSSNGGNGGIGFQSSITGTATYYAGGGAGYGYPNAAGSGGLGGGGAGGSNSPSTAPIAGTANTGGGGGAGAAGGSGIALISSPYVAAVSSLTGSPTIIGLPSFTNYSGSFNGTNQYLNSTAGAAAINFGTGAYTIEFWIYSNSRPSTSFIFGGTGTSYQLGMNTSGNIFISKAGTGDLTTSTIAIPLTAWTHVAIVRTSTGTNGATYYINGVSAGSVTDANNYNGTGVLDIATTNNSTTYCINGYLSNFRITNTAVYTSAFTPSTVPLTAITGTQLLTLQNATITDTSTNAFTITNNGSVTTTSTVQPFPQAPITSYVYKFTSSGSLTYTTNTFLNYAASFNGSSQYLTVPNNTPLQFSGNFTIECWINPTSRISLYPCILTNGNAVSAGQISIFPDHSVIPNKYTLTINGVYPAITSTTSVVYGTWVHLALVRNSGVCTFYINGISNGTYSTSASLNGVGSNWYIGVTGDNIPQSYYNGYISNLRVTNTAVYTSAFTPPTTHLTAVSGTQLLTCQNAALVDNSNNNFTITNNGSVTTTYTTVPFNY